MNAHDGTIQFARRIPSYIPAIEPRTPDELHAFVRGVLGFNVPRLAIVEGHAAPFDYLAHAFFEDSPGPRDSIVWANRGGGKTQLGAIATMLDLLFKPGIQVRILAGSFEQSSKMYAALREMLREEVWQGLIVGGITGRHVEFVNGARVEVLSQSERSVRGQRVHRLRCDEVELFDEDIWTAAQMVTRSGLCGEVFVRGGIEVLSTMHRPWGLMQRLLDEAAADPRRRRVFRWNVLDVLEKCPPQRPCESCALQRDCGGRAKGADGFMLIDDVITQLRRVSEDAWRAEMLCERPSGRDLVYPEFDPAVHVRPFGGDASLTAEGREDESPGVQWIGGMDFGYRALTVLLWAVHEKETDVLHIVGEHAESERTIEHHIEAAQRRERSAAAGRCLPRPRWIGADPAGRQRNDQTGRSAIALWRSAGYTIRTRSSRIETGIEMVRSRLRDGAGRVRLLIDPACGVLIRALSMYHYPPAAGRSDGDDDVNPVKDGPDHAADALRYMVVNLDSRAGRVVRRPY